MKKELKELKAIQANHCRKEDLMDLIAETLAETGTPPWNDLDLEAATHALSDEDLPALDDLGSSSEVVSRMLGKISEDTTTQLERTTEMMSRTSSSRTSLGWTWPRLSQEIKNWIKDVTKLR